MEGISPVVSGRERDTPVPAVTDGTRAGHPPSTTNNCQELGVVTWPQIWIIPTEDGAVTLRKTSQDIWQRCHRETLDILNLSDEHLDAAGPSSNKIRLIEGETRGVPQFNKGGEHPHWEGWGLQRSGEPPNTVPGPSQGGPIVTEEKTINKSIRVVREEVPSVVDDMEVEHMFLHGR
ncbi:hypothetical protein M0804_013972 [Polistes exclamans]|nr:hypothetical protein M0804_013972 [Polistes exclamans]